MKIVAPAGPIDPDGGVFASACSRRQPALIASLEELGPANSAASLRCRHRESEKAVTVHLKRRCGYGCRDEFGFRLARTSGGGTIGFLSSGVSSRHVIVTC